MSSAVTKKMLALARKACDEGSPEAERNTSARILAKLIVAREEPKKETPPQSDADASWSAWGVHRKPWTAEDTWVNDVTRVYIHER